MCFARFGENWILMHNNPIYGITIGDASGVGPEILLKAFANGEIRWRFVAYGDLEALRFYNERLGYRVRLREVLSPAQYEPGTLNVLNQGLLQAGGITPGRLSREAGRAAREYVVSASRAALAGQIAAMVTLPMNKE